MKKGDIVLIPFPFTDLTGAKKRPALVLISTETDITVCFITTQHKWQSEFDFEVEPTEMNGLKQKSLVRLNKMATIDKDLAIGLIGKLDEIYFQKLNENLIQLFQIKR